jgi:hypothetical protein
MEKVVPLVEIIRSIFYFKKIELGKVTFRSVKFEQFESNLGSFKFEI